ncbi:ATP-grasp domain-containing protein [Alienimonas californiensis]|uniref:ATP-grasp domain protein n=1 Tax=Alienimonas californiensis TaxID=2527989 RepID=A0A517P7F0_9PLAN|nr:ATP-grasp domain-containing protein [Alienimonas californiensis]QDT15311.1 ATP-grasp domain protein [Alienimonas californiensis]
MRVFLSEHLTCGAVHQAEANPLFPEGAAMLRALAADAAQVDGVQVVVTWAAGLVPFGVPGVEVVEVPSVRQEPWFFGEQFGKADRTLHIAPEEALGMRAYQYGEFTGDAWLGCTASAVEQAGDKTELHRIAAAAGVRRPAILEGVKPLPFPFVRKLEDGAGGDAILFRDNADFTALSPELNEIGDPPDVWMSLYHYFSEQYIPGRPCSVAVINDDPLPAGVQDVRIDGSPGRLSYHGGMIPAPEIDQAAVRRLVAQVYEAVPGLRGWWGIDFVIPDEPFEGSFDPVLIEVNPRLTTSYLGYRALTPDNLAERLLFSERPFPPLRWRPGTATFTKGGRVDVSP